MFSLKKTFTYVRSSRPEVFCKKGVLRNFAKFTGKHLCQSLFFSKVPGETWVVIVSFVSFELCEFFEILF